MPATATRAAPDAAAGPVATTDFSVITRGVSLGPLGAYMTRITRRLLLRAAGVGVTVGLGGCLADGPGGDPTDDPNDGPTDTDEPGTATDGDVEFTVRQMDADLPDQDWYDTGASGNVAT